MFDLDILESTFFDDEDENQNVEVESADEYTTEAAMEVTKVLAAIAATLALGALLLVVIKKIKKKDGGESKKGEKPLQLESPERKMVNEMESGIKTNISNLKDLRAKYKKEMKGANKETKKAIRGIIKDINKNIREMKGFAKKIAKIAKKASIPIDKINQLAEQIQSSINSQSMDANFSKESTESEPDEYEAEFDNLFESVAEESLQIYENAHAEKEDEFDFSLDDILG